MIVIKVQKSEKYCSELVKVSDVMLNGNELVAPFNPFVEKTFFGVVKYVHGIVGVLGQYQSDRRAEEVFNEIVEAVAGGQKVYFMPEE
jgi:hypothetical protein